MRESEFKRRAMHKQLEGMEEESEQAEKEIQDSEYDSFFSDNDLSDEEDKAIYCKLVVEPFLTLVFAQKTHVRYLDLTCAVDCLSS